MALMTATSCTSSPKLFMCRLRYGYNTVMEADWKKKMNLIQTKCRIRKSLKTHLSTVTSFCSHLVQQLLGSCDSLEEALEAAVEAILEAFSAAWWLGLLSLGRGSLPLAIMLSQQMLPNLELSSKLDCCFSLRFFILFSSTLVVVASKFLPACFPWWTRRRTAWKRVIHHQHHRSTTRASFRCTWRPSFPRQQFKRLLLHTGGRLPLLLCSCSICMKHAVMCDQTN